MTGTQPDSRGETIIVKQIQTLHLCIWKIMTWEAAQLKPGYNIQIGGDSQYIVSADIFQDQNTVWTLVSFLKNNGKGVGVLLPKCDRGFGIWERRRLRVSERAEAGTIHLSTDLWEMEKFSLNRISTNGNIWSMKKQQIYTYQAGKKGLPQNTAYTQDIGATFVA